MSDAIQLNICSIALRELSLFELIPLFADMGYDGIEVFGLQVEKATDAELMKLRQVAELHGIALPVVAPYFVLTRGEAEYVTTMQTAQRFVHIARMLGCTKIRTFTDVAQGVASGVAEEHHWEQAVRGLQQITAMAPDLQFVVETHPLTLADTVPSTLRLLQRVNRPNLKVNFQPNESFLAFGLTKAFDALQPDIVHMHLQQLTPNHTDGWLENAGFIDFSAFIGHIKSAGYSGSISVEYCWKGVPFDRVQTAHKYLRTLLAM